MYQGIYTPSITILKEDGQFDYPNMQKHIDRLIDGGVNGILFFGSIGEFFAFSLAEKKEFIDFAVKAVKQRVPVIVGIGGTIMSEIIDLAKYCQRAGVDSTMLIAPYYFGPSDQAAFKFFSDVASAVDIPMFLYNFPARTGSDLNPELVCQLALAHKNIIGIKDTVDNISHTRKIAQKIKPVRADFSILSGFDEYYLVNRVSGADGVLCGLTNVEPQLFATLHRAYEAKNFAQVTECAEKIALLMRLYDSTDLFVSGIKASVRAKGLDIATGIREPSISVTAAQYQKIQQIIAAAQ